MYNMTSITQNMRFHLALINCANRYGVSNADLVVFWG